MKKWPIFILIACFSLLAIAGCDSEPVPSAQNNERFSRDNSIQKTATEGKYITILTGGTSGVYFQIGNSLAKIYGEKLGAKASTQTTVASVDNTLKIHQKAAEIGFAMADIVGDAYKGKGAFERVGPLTNLSSIASLYPNYMQIITSKKTGITSLLDLKGKRIAVGSLGSGTEIMANRVLEASGLTYEDVQVEFLSFAEGIEAIRNETMDAAFLSSGYPNLGIMELAATDEIRLIPIPKILTEKLKKTYPTYSYSVIPGNTYQGIPQDVETTFINNMLITYKDLPNDEVYELTKTLFENIEVLREAHNSAKQIELGMAAKGLPIPLHPGALRYYKEKNVLP